MSKTYTGEFYGERGAALVPLDVTSQGAPAAAPMASPLAINKGVVLDDGWLLNHDRAVRCVLIAFLALTLFLLLFLFRDLDDNRLTSWQWVFANANLPVLLFQLCVGLLIAYLLAGSAVRIQEHPLTLFVVSYAVATIFWREPEVIIDSARYFTQAKHIEQYGIAYFLREWGNEVPAWTDLPLIPFLYGIVLKLFGESRYIVQSLCTLFFSTTVVMTYLIGKQLWSRALGLSAGVLLLAMPYLLTQVPLTMSDVPSMFFLTLAVLASIRALQTGGAVRLALAAAAIVLAMLAKYSIWLMLSVIPVIALVELGRQGRPVFGRVAGIAAWVVLLLVPILLWRHDLFAHQLHFLHDYQYPGLYRWGESYISTFLFQLHPFIALMAVVSIFAAAIRRDPKYFIISWMLFLLVLFEIKRIRYSMITFPMLALMAAYGLDLIKDHITRRFTVLAAVVSSLVIAVFGHLAFLQTTSAANLQRAGDYLDAVDQQLIEVYTLPQIYSVINPAVSVPIMDLFTNKPIIYRRNAGLENVKAPPQIATSPLRFTWELPDWRFFDESQISTYSDKAIVVILSDPGQVLPAKLARDLTGYTLTKEFREQSGVFRYRTIVQIYQPTKSI